VQDIIIVFSAWSWLIVGHDPLLNADGTKMTIQQYMKYKVLQLGFYFEYFRADELNPLLSSCLYLIKKKNMAPTRML